MKRREFIAALGGIAIARPSGLGAQQARPLPRIGRLSIGNSQSFEDAFRQGLRDFGYVEGQNLLVEYRRAGETPGQLDGFAAELVALKVDVIVAASSQTTRAAFNQTKTIPIVTLSTNPVGLGFVTSLAKPGGNVTGVSLLGPEVSGKRLQLLKQAVPGVTRVAVIWNPDDPAAHFSVEESQTAAAALGLKLQVLEGRNANAIDGALQAAANAQAEAVVLLPTPLFDGLGEQIAGLAMRRRLPTLYFSKDPVKAGILMSYGPDILAASRRQAYFVDRILKGTKPADLPVEQPAKFELAINQKTAKALGLNVPESLLASADEVIE
jgi:putative tryptophan/tyrosine transport system substrate-binding protein